MQHFLETLKHRNETLFIFGAVCFIMALIFLILTRYSDLEVMNANAWFKPFKFSVSTGIFSWTMAWIGYYLNAPKEIQLFTWVIVITLGFEILYISIQAGRGQLSHFNVSTPFYQFMFSMMALAATIATLCTAYIGWLFFVRELPGLSPHYLWGIRSGIVLFVIFSFEGFVMGSRMTHTIGGPDGGPGIWLLNWSTQYGDPRIAHFIGMHALQVIPLLSYYLLKSTKATLIVAVLYGLLAIWVLLIALQGRPLFKL